MRRLLEGVAVLVILLCLPLTLGQGCDGGGYYSDDCIGPDGYNWCLAGSWDGMTIHEPSVPLMDFSPYGYD